MEANPIQTADVMSWCRLHMIEDAQLIEDIWTVVHLVDRHRMNEMRESKQQDKPSNSNANTSRRN